MSLLEEIQAGLFARAVKFRDEHTTRVESYDEFKSVMEGRPGFVIAGWCGSADCEAQIKAETQATLRNIPFGSEKKTYPFWDGMLGTTVNAVYKGTDTIDGLRTYRYDVNVPTTPAEVVDGVQGSYTTDKSIWVEPRTGSIFSSV